MSANSSSSLSGISHSSSPNKNRTSHLQRRNSGQGQGQRSSSQRPAPPTKSITVLVESVLLQTILPNQRQFTRPIFVSTTALATGFASSFARDGLDSTIQLFVGTHSRLNVILRIMAPQIDIPIKLIVYESLLFEGAVKESVTENLGMFHPCDAEAGYAFLLSLPLTSVRPLPPSMEEGRGAPMKRIQIFDGDKRLLFSMEWILEVGCLTEDAISWLEDSNFPINHMIIGKEAIDDYAPAMGAGRMRPFQHGQSGVAKRSTTTPPAARPETRKIAQRARQSSVTEGFIDVQDESKFSRSLSISRSNSIIGSRKLSQERSGHEGQDAIKFEPLPVLTVDLIQQLGFWLYGTRIGQIVTNQDPRGNLKAWESTGPIWLLGRQFVNDRLSGPSGYGPRVLTLGAITRLIPAPGLVSFLGVSREIKPDSEYSIREVLLVSNVETKINFDPFVKWLKDNGSSIEGSSESSLTVVKGGIIFTVKIQVVNLNSQPCLLVDCSIQSNPDISLNTRTIYMDIITGFLSCVTGDSFDAMVDVVFQSCQNCNLEVGPYPPTSLLTRSHSGPFQYGDGKLLNPNDDPFISMGKTMIKFNVLLWSEHIRDWIFRELYLDASFRVAPTGIAIRLAEFGMEQLDLDLSQTNLYIFTDSSLRFALSIASVKSWLCFRAICTDDHSRMMVLISFLLKRRGSANSPDLDEYSRIPLTSGGKHQPETIVSTLAKASPPIIPTTRTLSRGPNTKAPSPSPDNYLAGMEELLKAIESRFWFTYRRDIPRLAPSILTSDAGYGCMIRAGQSMLAEALGRLAFGQNWNLHQVLTDDTKVILYKQIISLFLDRDDSSSIFRLSNIVKMGAELGIPIGQTFSPTILSRSLLLLLENHAMSPSREKLTTIRSAHEAHENGNRNGWDIPFPFPFNIVLVKNGLIDLDEFKQLQDTPLIVLIPLRLGADYVNEDYFPLIRKCLMTPLSLGIIGGRNHRAYYIIGYQGTGLLFLDPHVVRPVNVDLDRVVRTGEYHTQSVCEMALTHLDPTVLLSFLVKSEEDVRSLVKILLTTPLPMPLFSCTQGFGSI